MLNEHIMQSVKITLGVFVAVMLAKMLGMEFYTSVGTIVIVSMLSAKKQSIRQASIYLLASLVSLTLASALFSFLGYSFAIFMLYILIFTFLMHKLNMKVAIVLNVVLVMHIFSLKEISLSILANEFGLMFLGITVALIANFFIIDIESELIKYQERVESLFNNIFKNMGKCLERQCKTEAVLADLKELDELLFLAKERSYNYMNNYYIRKNNYYVEYFGMRRRQYYIVKTMQKFLKLKFLNEEEVKLLKDFTDDFVNNTRVMDSCQNQIDMLSSIKQHFTYKASIPTTHSKLQTRLALHQYLYSLEDLVSVKMRFIDKYEKK